MPHQRISATLHSGPAHEAGLSVDVWNGPRVVPYGETWTCTWGGCAR